MRKLLPVVLAVPVVFACTYARDDVAPYRPAQLAAEPGRADAGRHLYMRDCAWCHGNTGRGTERGPDLVTGTSGPALIDFVLSTGRMPLAEPDDLALHDDPAYTPEQIAAIVAFVEEAFQPPGPDIPDVDPELGDLAVGLELYQENCAACHSTTGIGGALTTGESRRTEGPGAGSIIAPGLERSTAREIAEAMLVGPGTMPVFGPGFFTDHEVDSIVRYVSYLQDPLDRGGADVGRIGPVMEGAIGWILGLGLIVLLTRWIGTKAGE